MYKLNLNYKSKKNKYNYELTEKDFYPPADTRYWISGVEDLNTNTFAQYCKDYFKYCEEWDYYEG